MAEKESDEAEAVVPAGGGGGSKILPILVIMNTLLVGGVLFFVMKKSPAPATAAVAEGEQKEGAEGAVKKESGPGFMIKLENFVIQLRSADAERYVRVAFDLEVNNQATDEPAVRERLSIIRDAVISYFSDRTLDELRGSEGMERTKAALLKKMDEIIPGRRVRNVYITDFIIQ